MWRIRTIEVGDPKYKFSLTCGFAKSINTLNFKENELLSYILHAPLITRTFCFKGPLSLLKWFQCEHESSLNGSNVQRKGRM